MGTSVGLELPEELAVIVSGSEAPSGLSGEITIDGSSTVGPLTERIAEDRYVLAVVLVGSLTPETIWHRESLGLWIIEADGVSRRLPSDGSDERVFRILVENGINIHAEVIPRSLTGSEVMRGSREEFPA